MLDLILSQLSVCCILYDNIVCSNMHFKPYVVDITNNDILWTESFNGKQIKLNLMMNISDLKMKYK